MIGSKVRLVLLVGCHSPEFRFSLERVLNPMGYALEHIPDADTIAQVLAAASHPVVVVIVDSRRWLDDSAGATQAICLGFHIPVILLSSDSNREVMRDAFLSGASDFFADPVSCEYLALAVARAASVPDPVAVARPDSNLENNSLAPGYNTFASSGFMRSLFETLRQVGESEIPVLIQGETGTGKEVIARELHRFSARASKPFLKLNCAALPSELVESELFGYEKGAFTGAFQRKPGMFELADEGTILLDEIGDMDVKLQAKLLQILQDQSFQRLGGRDMVQVNVRIIAATHRDLVSAIDSGQFREDLYYRLNILNIYVPPLRERRDEVIPLAEYFIRRHSKSKRNFELPDLLKECFKMHDWPGNIRELENVVRKFLVVGDATVIEQDLRLRSRRRPLQLDGVPRNTVTGSADRHILSEVHHAKEEAEKVVIEAALDATRWNRKEAARFLNIDYKALLYKMKRLSLEGKSRKAGVAS